MLRLFVCTWVMSNHYEKQNVYQIASLRLFDWFLSNQRLGLASSSSQKLDQAGLCLTLPSHDRHSLVAVRVELSAWLNLPNLG